MDNTIRVLLADDHPLVRAGIRATLIAEDGFVVVGEAASGDETQRMCAESKPDVLLLDVHMPGPSAVETVRFVREQYQETKILILTAYDSDAYVRSLIAAGAVGYVLKEEATQVVIRAIRTVLQGDTWFSRAIVEKMAGWHVAESTLKDEFNLTEREREMLSMVAQGWDNSHIAEALHVAEQTVRNRLSSIYGKVGIHSRGELIIWTRKQGLPD